MNAHRALATCMALAVGVLSRTDARADEGERGQKGEIEQEVPPHAVPAPAWDTIVKETEGARIEKIELESEEGTPFYEAHFVTPQGDKYELKVDVDGKLLEKELED